MTDLNAPLAEGLGLVTGAITTGIALDAANELSKKITGKKEKRRREAYA